MLFTVPEDFGFQLTILAESSPQVNILPATTAIFKYVFLFVFLFLFTVLLLCASKSSASGNFHPVNSQNGIVVQATLVMQLLKGLPTCVATIRKIHSFIYGSGDPLSVAIIGDHAI